MNESPQAELKKRWAGLSDQDKAKEETAILVKCRECGGLFHSHEMTSAHCVDCRIEKG